MTNRSLIIIAIILIITTGIIWFKQVPHTSPTAPINSLVIGTNAEFPPFSFIENDQIVGFDIDVITEVARRLNKKISFANMSFEALIPELQMGTIAAIAAGMTPTPERAQKVFFTTPHFTGDPLIAITKKGTFAITNPAELRNKTVVVNQGYTADQFVTNLGVMDIVRLSTPLISTGLLALNSGQADVFIASKSSLQTFLKQQKDNYTITPLAGTAESSAIAVSKKYPALFTAIESTISDMIRDGTMTTLQKKWNLHD